MTQATLPADVQTDAHTRQRIVVGGAVQGVGFRPFVYREATALGLTGWVRNATEGVIIEVEGRPAAVAGLLEAIRHSPPVNARIAGVVVHEIEPQSEPSFTIQPSEGTGMRSAQVLPDLAICEACLIEMFDPTDRRYRYPFINCTQCGPRYSIVED